MRELTEKEIEYIELCGRVGFSCNELAAVLSVPVADIEDQFRAGCGSVYEPWLKGRLQVELELRNAMLREALNGSSPMMEKVLSIFRHTNESINKLTY